MLAYVKQPYNFKNAIVRLAFLPELDSSLKEFNFINGTNDPTKHSKIYITFLGNDPDSLRNKLNKNSFKNYGDPNFSDLTRMFENALNSVRRGEISILISDCIYDVGNEIDPLNSLQIETQKTQKLFRDRINSDDIQTILIKANSKFDGTYCCASKTKYIKICQNRPYYILIFGESKLLNKIFTEFYISKEIAGFEAMARFFKIDKFNLPYQATSQNSKGRFSFDKKNKNKLTINEKSRTDEDFQFSIATDLSSLPFPDSYIKSKDNYIINNNFTIKEITGIATKIVEITSFNPTHLITVHSNSNPYGNLTITLKYMLPSWIKATDIENDTNILNDTIHTFGFSFLTNAITKAYEYKNKQQNIANFKIELLK